MAQDRRASALATGEFWMRNPRCASPQSVGIIGTRSGPPWRVLRPTLRRGGFCAMVLLRIKFSRE